MDLNGFAQTTVVGLWQDVARRRWDLWNTQKEAKGHCMEWPEEEAKTRAKAACDKDWEKRLNEMVWTMADQVSTGSLG